MPRKKPGAPDKPKGRPKGMDTAAIYEKAVSGAAEEIALIPEVVDNLPVPAKRKKTWWENSQVKKAIQSTGQVAETDDQRRAFDEYMALGDGRSLAAVARKIGRNPNVISQWASKHNWTKRVIEWAQDDSLSRSIEPIESYIANKKFSVKIIDKILQDAVTLDDEGNILTSNIRATTAADLRTLITLRNDILNINPGKTDSGKGGGTQIGQAVFIIKK
jgi:hypothetical protein